MPAVKLRFFASPREIVGERELHVKLPAGATVRSLLDDLYKRYPDLRRFERVLLVSVNQDFAPPERTLSDGDEIAIMPPVSGGGDDLHVAIQKETASLEALLTRVADPRAGAIASFVGVVRGENRGEAVTAIEYEIYEELALRELARIAAEARSKFEICKLAIVHRRGRFTVGEPVVWIVVSAPHREESFAACRFVIGELKTRAPIWKREHGLQRARWVETGERETRLWGRDE